MKTVCSALAVLVFVLTSHTPAQDPPKDKPKTGAAAYDAFPEAVRDTLAKEWEAEVETAKKQVQEYVTIAGKTSNTNISKRKELTVMWQMAKKRLAELQKNTPPFIGRERRLAMDKQAQEEWLARLTPEQKAAREVELERLRKQKILDDAEREERAAKAAVALKAAEEYDANGLVLLRKTVSGTSNRFHLEITGTVINRRPKKVSYAQITYNVYDESGARIGTALANINDLEPGGRWNFKAVSLGTEGKRFKLNELSGY